MGGKEDTGKQSKCYDCKEPVKVQKQDKETCPGETTVGSARCKRCETSKDAKQAWVRFSESVIEGPWEVSGSVEKSK